MRATTLLASVLGVKHTRVRAIHLTARGVVADVAPTMRVPRCSSCGRRARRVHDRRPRLWRHLDLAGLRLWLRHRLRRVVCARCGVSAELVPWAEPGVWFTRAFTDAVTYLARCMDFTAVATLARTTPRTVVRILTRTLASLRAGDGLDDLTAIGIDEIAYRRGHRYLTVVVDHVGRRVVWSAPGHDKATARRFFKALGTKRIAKVRVVTMDLSATYREAVREAAPEARLVFDRFHVARLAHRALDRVRLAAKRACTDPAWARDLKAARRALMKHSHELSETELAHLARIERRHPAVRRAYDLKEGLADVFDSPDVPTARRRFEAWHRSATHVRLPSFRRLAHTLGPLREGIYAYVELHLTNALAEAMNLKIRHIIEQGFGVPDTDNLIARIFLHCGGLPLPADPYPPRRASPN